MLRGKWGAWAAVILTAAVCAAAGGFLFDRVTWLNHLELRARPVARVPLITPVAVVQVNHETFDRLDTVGAGGILPRKWYAQLLTRLKRAGTRVVLFDIDFSEASDDDSLVADAIAEVDPLPVIVGALPDRVAAETDYGSGDYRFLFPKIAKGITPDNLRIGALVAWEPDHIVRGFDLDFIDQATQTDVRHAAVEAVLAFEGKPAADVRRWPTSRAGEYSQSWIRDADHAPVYDFADVVQGKVSNENLAGRIVIVGSSVDAIRLNDLHPTDIGEVPGSVILAHAINSLAFPKGQQTQTASPAVNFGVALLLAALALKASLSNRWQVLAGAAAVSMLLGAGLPHFALAVLNLRLGTVTSIVSIVLAAAAGVVVQRQIVWSRLPIFIRSGWVSGQVETATVLFADVCGSTALGGSIGDETLRRFLAESMDGISEVISAAGGVVERTMGDGVLAIFRGNRQFESAISCIQSLQARGIEIRRRYDPQFEGRYALAIGIEFGEIQGIVLHTGKSEEWSSMGLTLHRASRLQSLCGSMEVAAILGPTLVDAGNLLSIVKSVGVHSLKGLGDTEAYCLKN